MLAGNRKPDAKAQAIGCYNRTDPLPAGAPTSPLNGPVLCGTVEPLESRARNNEATLVGDRAITGCAASASQMGRFETKWLSRAENLAALSDLPGRWIDKVHTRRPPRIVVLDMTWAGQYGRGQQQTGSQRIRRRAGKSRDVSWPRSS